MLIKLEFDKLRCFMKKLIALLLSLFFVFSLVGCSNSYKINDLSPTASIGIYVHSIPDNSYVEYNVSDKEVIQETCELFSSLETKKDKTDKELGDLYTVLFFNHNGVEIETVVILSNVDNAIWVNSNSVVYKITSDVKIVERIEELLTTHGEVVE